jgi:hypothetical protein
MLVGAACAAGLAEGKRGAAKVRPPTVPDVALGYLLHLLREVRFDGTLDRNPYLASVGLVGRFLDHRLSSLPGASFHRVGSHVHFDWSVPSLSAWAEATL